MDEQSDIADTDALLGAWKVRYDNGLPPLRQCLPDRDPHRGVSPSESQKAMFTPETLVETPEGVRLVRDLRAGDEVWAYGGATRPVAVPVLSNQSVRWDGYVACLQTAGGFYGRFTDRHPVYGGFRASKRYFDLFLVERQGLGFYLGLANGSFRDLVRSPFSYELLDKGSDLIERLWLLRSLEDEEEALFEENWIGLEAGLPTFDLEPGIRGLSSDSRAFARLLEEVPTAWRAQRLLEHWGLQIDQAHFERKLIGPGGRRHRRFVEACAFWSAEHQGPAILEARHRLEVVPFTEGIRVSRDRITQITPGSVLVESFETLAQMEQKSRTSWSKSHSDVLHSLALAGQSHRAFRWRASYLRPGMKIPTFDEGRLDLDEIKRVDRLHYAGDLFALQLVDQGLPSIAGLIVGSSESADRETGASVRESAEDSKPDRQADPLL